MFLWQKDRTVDSFYVMQNRFMFKCQTGRLQLLIPAQIRRGNIHDETFENDLFIIKNFKFTLLTLRDVEVHYLDL